MSPAPRRPKHNWSLAAIAFAAFLAVLCLAPFALWGNPYPTQSITYWVVGTIAAVAIAVAGTGLSVLRLQDRLQSAIAFVSRVSGRVFALAIGCLAFVLSAIYSLAVFRRGASTTDELAHLWHARIMLSGRLSLPPDANPEFFALDTVVDVIRWYAHFPIGWSALMAPADALGIVWLINPLACGLTAVGLYLFGRRAYGEAAGRMIGAITALSPSIVILAGTMMSHSVVLALLVWTLVALVNWERATDMRRALPLAGAIGLLLGLTAVIRPVDALIASIVIGGVQLTVFRMAPKRLRELPLQLVAGVVGVAPLLIANARTTGRALLFGYEVQWGAAHSIGFHEDPYGRAYTPLMGVERAITYVSELNMYVTAWPVPAVLLAIVSAILLARVNRWDALLMAWFVLQVAAYASYGLVGEFLGPRFLFAVLPALVVLIARLPLLMIERTPSRVQRMVPLFFLVCVFETWAIPSIHMNAWGLGRIAASARQTLRLNVAEAVRAAGVQRALVFLREPFSARLTRRLWGVGATRSEAAQLLARKDACSLLTVVDSLERSRSVSRSTVADVLETAAAFENGPSAMESTDGVLQFNGPQSIAGECSTEVASDSSGGFVPFGLALPLEPIGKDGKIDGDIVFVADLGQHNEVLRERFDDRRWYRLVLSRDANGRPELAVVDYR